MASWSRGELAFTGTTNAIYSLDIDPATGKASGPLRTVTVYAGRKGPDYEKNKSDQTLINHCQVNPKYPDRIGYAHQYNASVSNGSWERARIWATYVDGRDEGPLLITPAGRWHTHEVWGPMGDWIYFVDSGDIARVNASDKRVQTLAKGLNPLALHLTVSAHESRIVFDTVSSWQYDKDDTLFLAPRAARCRKRQDHHAHVVASRASTSATSASSLLPTGGKLRSCRRRDRPAASRSSICLDDDMCTSQCHATGTANPRACLQIWPHPHDPGVSRAFSHPAERDKRPKREKPQKTVGSTELRGTIAQWPGNTARWCSGQGDLWNLGQGKAMRAFVRVVSALGIIVTLAGEQTLKTAFAGTPTAPRP